LTFQFFFSNVQVEFEGYSKASRYFNVSHTTVTGMVIFFNSDSNLRVLSKYRLEFKGHFKVSYATVPNFFSFESTRLFFVE